MARERLKSGWLWAIVGFLVGALLILVIRFATYHVVSVHYHANFAVFINGQREQFKSPFYYQEEGSCTAEEKITPYERAHMHDGINSVVHIHDNAVTWGAFFQNLGWVVDPRIIRTTTETLLPDNQNEISFILNGQPTDNITNKVIGDRDRLLVDYGTTSSADLQKEYTSVPSTAKQYDESTDPKSCGGSAPTTVHDRLTHLF